jgi:hypothetical protein
MGNKLHNFQSFIFWTISLSVFIVIFVLDFFDVCDPAILSYLTTGLAATISGLLFADWWRIKGDASSIYKWITLLLFALAFNDFIQCIARYAYVFQHGDYERVIDSNWWQYRSAPKMLALIYLLSFAVCQRWRVPSVCVDDVKREMSHGITKLDAEIVSGELVLEGYSSEGLVMGAKIVLKPREDDNGVVK